MTRKPEHGYQPESLEKMQRRLYVAVKQTGQQQWALVPVLHDDSVIYGAQHSELEFAEVGDLYVLHAGRLLHAVFTMMEGTIAVEMPAESSLIEQPLDK